MFRSVRPVQKEYIEHEQRIEKLDNFEKVYYNGYRDIKKPRTGTQFRQGRIN